MIKRADVATDTARVSRDPAATSGPGTFRRESNTCGVSRDIDAFLRPFVVSPGVAAASRLGADGANGCIKQCRCRACGCVGGCGWVSAGVCVCV